MSSVRTLLGVLAIVHAVLRSVLAASTVSVQRRLQHT